MKPAFSLAAALCVGAASASLPALPPPVPVIPPAAQSLQAPAASAPAPVPAAPKPGGEREAVLDLARRGLLDSALALSLQGLSRNPEDPFLLLMAGKLGPSGKEASESLKKAVKAGGDGPEAEEALFRLGQYTYATGKYHLAIPFFRDYLRRFPDGDWKQPALYWIGNASLALNGSRPDRTNYLDSAVTWFGQLLADTRTTDYYHPLALEGLAKAKGSKGDREGAWQTVQTALEKAPEEERAALLLLAAQVRQGVDRAGEKSLMAQLIAKYPQSPEARYLRKLNGAADTSKWKSGSSLPRVAAPPKDTAGFALPAAPDSLKAKPPAASTPAAAVPAKPAPPSGPLPFTLQCGAFTQSANAQAMLANLKKLGLSPELVERERGGKRIYTVRVGRFATPEAAEEFARANLKPRQVLSQPVPVGP